MRYPKDLFLALPLGGGAWWLEHVATTPLLAKMFIGLGILWLLDSLTGIGAAIELRLRDETQPAVTPATFIRKFGWKLIQAVAYLGIAWVLSNLLSEGMKVAVPLSEPMAFVLGALIGRDALSILRNLRRAGKSVPIIDKFFGKVMDSMNIVEFTHPRPKRKKTS